MAIHLATRIGHVGKYAGGTEENIIFDDCAGVNRNIVLDLDVTSDDYIFSNLAVLSKDTSLSDFCALQDMRVVPDLGARADFAWFIDDCGGVGKVSLFRRLGQLCADDGLMCFQGLLARLQTRSTRKPSSPSVNG